MQPKTAIRLFVASFSIAVATFAFSQSIDQKVTYTCTGIPAKAICDALTQSTGVRLATSGVMATEPMIIKVTDLPLSKLLEKIAWATDGNWIVESDGTRRLVANKKPGPVAKPTPETVERMKKIQAKMRAQLAKEAEFDGKAANALLVEIDEFLKGGTSDQEYYKRGEAIGAKGPLTTLAKRIAVELDPRQLALVERSKRLVLSTRPTQSQLPLPQSCLAHLNRFAKEYEAWKGAVGNRTFRYPEDRGMPTSIYYLINRNMEWNEHSADESNKLTKALVFLTSWNGDGAGQIEVKIVNEEGRYVAQATEYFGNIFDSENDPSPFDPSKSPTDPNEPDVKFEPDSQEYVDQLMKIFGGSSGSESVSGSFKSLEARILSPEKIDPISLAIPELLIQFADYKKLNVVACPPDFLVIMAAFSKSQGNLKTSKIFEFLKRKDIGCDIEIDNEFLLIGNRASGTQIPKPMQSRADRRAIGQTLRNLKQNGYLSIEAKAESAYRAGDDGFQGDMIMMFYVGLINPDESRMMQSLGETTWYRLYGSMNASQRQAILRGSKVLVRDLSPEQKLIIQTHAYGRNYGLNYAPKDASKPDTWRDFHEGIKGEPTERWPGGMPAGTTLTMAEIEDQVVIPEGRQSNGSQNFIISSPRTEMNAREFAQYLVSRDNPEEFYGPGYQPPVYTSYRFAERRRIEVLVQFDDEVTANGTLTERRKVSAKVNSFDQLPADFRAAVAKEKERIVKETKARVVPPPPTI